MTDYGVIIVGGGHAGSDAAAASARMGVKTALITHKFSTIGEMSCNPAIGGLGKGHLVREIDALDGVMARIADKGGIQFKVLNRRKGPAVRGPRAQADRKLYREAMQAELRATEHLDIIEAEVDDLIVENDIVVGVVLLDGTKYFCSSVVLTTGTFLRGLIHLGADSFPAGRHGERPVLGLSTRLENLGLELGRLKTGTPARLDGRTINWDILEKQEGDEEIEPFSSLTDKITNPQVTCYETRTNPETHRIIEENLHLSALYGGRIQSRGPRYCPSIEDKVVRFAEKDNHLVFLEPEGLDDDTVYPNGVSSCLPEDVQLAFFRTMKGLENVEFFRPGYAIEYDFVDPRQLTHELMLKKLPGLFLAGQINGTTGYEEAAAQGLFAGANAALRAQGKAPWHLSRTNSYIGVMIDDLIARGVTEPYRMFTSRAEFRLHLRVDNADQRLTDIGAEIGLIGEKRLAYHAERKAKLDAGRLLLQTLNATPNEARKSGLAVNSDGVRRTAFEILSYPTTEKQQLFTMWPELQDISPEIFEQLTVDAQYAVYLERQQTDVDAVKRDEQRLIPSWLSFDDISGLSNEIRYKLNLAKPQTIAQAQKIEGITPSALMLILAVMRRGTIDKKAS